MPVAISYLAPLKSAEIELLGRDFQIDKMQRDKTLSLSKKNLKN